MDFVDPQIAGDSAARPSADGRLSVDQSAEPRKSSEADRTSQQTSAFQAAVAAWRNIDLTTLQKSLDSAVSEMVNGQRDSLVERKELASKTKEYKKLDEEAKKEEWKGLLKSYQTFIDHLTTSRKATENAFMQAYQALSEAPDPYPLLEATIDSLVNYSEMQTMTKDNASLNATINRLSGQISNLESSLAAKNKELEKKDQEKADEAKRVEEVYKGVLDEKTRNWEGKEKALLEKVEHQENLLKEMKASYEVAERMGPKSPGGDDDLIAKERSAEMEILTRDLERTTSRLAEVESRNEQLRLQLEKASSHDGQVAPNERAEKAKDEEDEVLSRLREENAGLLRKMENVKNDLGGQKKEWERKIKALERTIEGLRTDKDALKDKVARWSDYEEIRRELEILKSIEFSTGDDDDDDDLDFSKTGTADSNGQAEARGNKKESLEQMLLARNKKLGHEMTVMRVSHQDLSSRLESLQQTLDQTTSELAAAQSLNQKLEDDLLKFQQETQHSGALSVAGTYVSRYPQSSYGGGRRMSPASSMVSGAVGNSSQTSLEALRANEAAGSGILPMITAQRDRFKQRAQQLEEELSRSQSTVSSLRQEVGALSKDNLQLYEKTRYVASYSRPAATAYSAANSGSGLSIDRYRAAYESNISPFEAFRGRESARAYQRMGVFERLIYSLTRVILANRTSRNMFVGYCVLLHLLVFGMLYYTGTTEVEKHLPGMAHEHLDAAAAAAAGAGAAGGAQAGDWHQQSFDDRL